QRRERRQQRDGQNNDDRAIRGMPEERGGQTPETVCVRGIVATMNGGETTRRKPCGRCRWAIRTSSAWDADLRRREWRGRVPGFRVAGMDFATAMLSVA